MPQAVLHILVPLILAALFKDWYDKKHKNKLPLHYVLIAGIAGVVPDLDIAAFWLLQGFGFTLSEIHRTFAHTIFVPLLFLILYFIFVKADVKARICNMGRHNLKLSAIFLALSFGSIIHLILDATFSGFIVPLYPISNVAIGLNLVSVFQEPLRSLFLPSLEGGLLVLWLIYLELKHKISDFI